MSFIKSLCIFLLNASIVFSFENTGCADTTEIFGQNVTSSNIKSINYPIFHCNNKSVYMIEPNKTHAIQLTVLSSDLAPNSKLRIWQTFLVDGELKSMFVSEQLGNWRQSGYTDYAEYTAPPNVGFRVEFDGKGNENKNHKGLHIEFFRTVPNKKTTCNFPVVYISEETTIIQKSSEFEVNAGCIFYLIPKPTVNISLFSQMEISVGASPDVVSLVRSYNSDGVIESDMTDKENKTILLDAQHIQIITRRNRKSIGYYKLAEISAKLIRKSCLCGEENLILNDNTPTHIIYPPGYPHLYCSNITCQYTIRSQKNIDAGKTAVLLVELVSKIGKDDHLTLNTRNSTLYSSEPEEENNEDAAGPFISTSDKVELSYRTGTSYRLRKMFFNATRVLVDDECVCSNLYKEYFAAPSNFTLRIPSKCNYLYCNFKFGNTSEQNIEVNFHMTGNRYGEKILFTDDKSEEKYEDHILDTPQMFISSRGTVKMSVIRINPSLINLSDETTNIEIDWNYNTACSCPHNQIIYLNEKETRIIKSPNYPQNYCPNLKCHYHLVTSPGRNFQVIIDDLEVENLHDILNISTVDRLSGSIEGKKFYINDNIFHIEFETDETEERRGFHITITSVDGKLRRIFRYITFVLIGAALVYAFLCYFVVPVIHNDSPFISINEFFKPNLVNQNKIAAGPVYSRIYNP